MKSLPIVSLLLLLLAVGAQAVDIGAEEMFDKHASRNDNVGVANTFMRCSGLFAIMAKETEKVNQEVFEQSLMAADAMQRAAVMIYASEGYEYEQKTITGWTVDWAHQYQDRFEKNMMATGEKFGSDDQIKADLQFCAGVAQVAQGV